MCYGIIGLFLQAAGVTVILWAQARFYSRGRKKYGNKETLKKAFLDITCPQAGYTQEDLGKMSVKEAKEALEKIELAKWLYDDFKWSVIGLFITLVGIILSMFG